ncbi:MAG: SEL1-like repeat protein [Rhodospirillales bacterium]
MPPNFAEAAIWYNRAAEAGHAAAARALGLLFLTGAGVHRDPEEASRWFRRAAEGGDRQAQADLANLLLSGTGTDNDRKRTRELFEQAAAPATWSRRSTSASCLAEGVGVEKDDRRAMLWLRRAADGVVNAQYWYGRMLMEGRGLEADPSRVVPGSNAAADAGMADAQVAIAELMLNGAAGPKDHPAALALFKRAAERRAWSGRCSPSVPCLAAGMTCPRTRPRRRRGTGARRKKGPRHAQMMLGRFLMRGLGGERDDEAARRWLEKAKAQGLAEAGADLDRLASQAAAD